MTLWRWLCRWFAPIPETVSPSWRREYTRWSLSRGVDQACIDWTKMRERDL